MKLAFTLLSLASAAIVANAATYQIDFGTLNSDSSTDYTHIGGSAMSEITGGSPYNLGDSVQLTVSGSGGGLNMGNALAGGCYVSGNGNNGTYGLTDMAAQVAALSGLSTNAVSDSIAISGTNPKLNLSFTGLAANTTYDFKFVAGRANTNSVANNLVIQTTTGSISDLAGSYLANSSSDFQTMSFDANGKTSYAGINLYYITFSATSDDLGNLVLALSADSSGSVNFNINAMSFTAQIPEPATASLGLLGLTALMLRRKRA